MKSLKDRLADLGIEMKKLPNSLTLVRIGVIPILLLLYPLNFFVLNVFCAVIFAIAAITDFFDGYIARNFNSVSKLGTVLDPLADKMLVATGLILIGCAGALPAWMVGVLICRELAISGLRLVAIEHSITINVNAFGKIKTCCQDVGIFCLLINKDLLDISFRTVGMVTIWFALLFSLYSAYLYAEKFWKEFKTV